MMKGEDCFKQNKSTLKDVSYDDKNKVYMTESTIPVYDFDGIKEVEAYLMGVDYYIDNNFTCEYLCDVVKNLYK